MGTVAKICRVGNLLRVPEVAGKEAWFSWFCRE